MANTYTLISSNVLSSSAASVTFSSIPSTYTDLVLRCSTRSNYAAEWQGLFLVAFETSVSYNYAGTILSGDGSAAASGRYTANSGIGLAWDATQTYGANSANNTANTFSSSETYIPNYTGTATKQTSNFLVGEANTTLGRMQVSAASTPYTSAITTLQVRDIISTFAIGSSFYLYGIKNS